MLPTFTLRLLVIVAMWAVSMLAARSRCAGSTPVSMVAMVTLEPLGTSSHAAKTLAPQSELKLGSQGLR